MMVVITPCRIQSVYFLIKKYNDMWCDLMLRNTELLSVYKPACAGSCPDPPPHSRVTFPSLIKSSMSWRTTTRCPCSTRRPGFTITKPSSASSTQLSTELISFLEDMTSVTIYWGNAGWKYTLPPLYVFIKEMCTFFS